MPKVDLAVAKLHLRVTGTAEDTLIDEWIKAAYLSVEGSIFRRVFNVPADIPEDDPKAIATNEAINSAVLLIVGHLYANREAVAPSSMAEMPLGAQWLLVPHVNTAGGF